MQRLDGQAQELGQCPFTLGSAESEVEGSDSAEDAAEEMQVPKLVVLYPYKGGNGAGGLQVGRGQELALLDASNADWWRVLTRDGMEGYVPANYCQLVPDETVSDFVWYALC